MLVDEDSDDALYECDRCKQYVLYEDSYSWYKTDLWRNTWNGLHPKGRIMACDEIKNFDYCKECYQHVSKYVMQMYDVLELKSYTNKLERNIRERIKNNRTA